METVRKRKSNRKGSLYDQANRRTSWRADEQRGEEHDEKVKRGAERRRCWVDERGERKYYRVQR
tara:strand:+ start:389 stop:580 length:192 start_codon:yes stop_codon:yes gene_type:complete